MKIVHVVAGIVTNAQQEILIALRPLHSHQGGLREFPGGKVEPGEYPEQALQRELLEEINLHILHAAPFLQIYHEYPDKKVFLDVWEIVKFSGEAKALEGQELRWVNIAALKDYTFPQANQAIVDKLNSSL